MEFVSPSLIIGKSSTPRKGEKLLLYKALKSLEPVRVDNIFNLLPEDKNETLFNNYTRDGLKLIPVKRLSRFKFRPDFPSRVLLEMTSRCNLNCTMCPRQELAREKIHIDTLLFRNCIDELDSFGIDGLWLYNIGESILHPNFPELLDYVSSKNNLGDIWHSSNGQELNETFSNMIINSKITYMNMSVNAATPETYKKISPDADWTIMTSNFWKFIELKRKAGKITPFTRLQIIDQEHASNEIDSFLKEYVDSADILSVNTLEAFSKDIETNIDHACKRERPDKKSCKRVDRQDLFIFSNGETTFCDTDYNGTFSMGNVHDKSIQEIWNSDFRKSIIELNREEKLNEVALCRNCMDFDL